jgi:hypothetical protein
MIAADSQQRSRERGELKPGDCGGRLKKEKPMVISAPSARGKGNCVALICRLSDQIQSWFSAPPESSAKKLTALSW